MSNNSLNFVELSKMSKFCLYLSKYDERKGRHYKSLYRITNTDEYKSQENIFKKMAKAKNSWFEFIDISFLSTDSKAAYKNLIQHRFDRLNQHTNNQQTTTNKICYCDFEQRKQNTYDTKDDKA